MSGVRFLDPRAEPGLPVEPYEWSIDLTATTDRPIVLGLLANGFPDSVNFLNHVQNALAELLPGLAFRRYDKGNASIPAPDALLEDVAQNCTAAIAAYGH